MFQCTYSAHIIDLLESCIFQCVKQNHLPFNILDETEEKVEPVTLSSKRSVLLEKIFNDLDGAELSFIAFFAVVEEQRKHNTGFLNAVKRQRCKQAVVQLKLDAHKILELLQRCRR